MSKRILIIEDHDAIRENVVEILKMARYTVFEAKNGKIGVEVALKEIPDIILCDIMMPELDGYGVLYMLNKHVETSGIPFIFLTAKAEHTDLRKGMELGADDYLIKPFDDMELLNAIDIRIRKKEAQDKVYRTSDEFTILVSHTDGLSEFQKLIEGKTKRKYKKGQIIYYEGDSGKGLYLVYRGRVKTIKLAQDGRELMTGMHIAGSYIGINAFMSGSVYNDTSTAIEDSEICLIPVDQLELLLLQYPEVARKFISLLSDDNREKEEQLLQLAYQSVRKKMAGAILRLYNQRVTAEHSFIVSREDLAAMACMATETVSRTLSDFREEKLIERNGANITVLNLDGLIKMKN